MNDTLTQIIAIISAGDLNVLGALAILAAVLPSAGWAGRMTRRALARTRKVAETVRHHRACAVRYGLIIFTIVGVVERFGVETTRFIAVLGAAGLAIGLAFQSALSHIAAGTMMLLFRPFKVGQRVAAAGVAGIIDTVPATH